MRPEWPPNAYNNQHPPPGVAHDSAQSFHWRSTTSGDFAPFPSASVSHPQSPPHDYRPYPYLDHRDDPGWQAPMRSVSYSDVSAHSCNFPPQGVMAHVDPRQHPSAMRYPPASLDMTSATSFQSAPESFSAPVGSSQTLPQFGLPPPTWGHYPHQGHPGSSHMQPQGPFPGQWYPNSATLGQLEEESHEGSHAGHGPYTGGPQHPS